MPARRLLDPLGGGAATVLAVVVLLATPVAAGATATIVLPDGSPAAQEQAWTDAAELPTPPTTVVEHPFDICPGEIKFWPCALITSADIYVPDPSVSDYPYEAEDVNPDLSRHQAFLHELAHMVDRPWTAFPDAARDEFRALINDDRPWRATGGNSPHEKFAEAWRICAWPYPQALQYGVNGAYDYHPTLAVHQQICAMIRRYSELLGWTTGPKPPPVDPKPVPSATPQPTATATATPSPQPEPSGEVTASTTDVDPPALDTPAPGNFEPAPEGRVLTVPNATSTLTRALRHRLAHIRRVHWSCRRVTTLSLRCTLSARHHGHRLHGTAAIGESANGRKVSYALHVHGVGNRTLILRGARRLRVP